MTMTRTRQWSVGTALGCAALVAGGWFGLVSPQHAQAADLHALAAQQRATNDGLSTQLGQLRTAARGLSRQQATLAAVAARIPDTRSMPALIRGLNQAAGIAGVQLLSVAPGASTLVPAPLGTVTVPVAPVGAAPSAGPAGSAAPAPARRPAAVTAGLLAQIPVSISIVGGYFQVEQFISLLENLPRSMRLTALAVTPGVDPLLPPLPVTLGAPTTPSAQDGRTLTTTVTGLVFLAVNRPAATAVTAPAPK